MSEEERKPRTKEEYIEAVRAFVADKGLDENETNVLVGIATLTGQKKLAQQLGVTIYKMQKTVKSIREKLGWANEFDTMRMGLYLLLKLSKDPKHQQEADWLYGDRVNKEEATARQEVGEKAK